MNYSSVNLETLEKLANNHFCRFPVLLDGDRASVYQLLEAFFANRKRDDIAWVSNNTPDSFQNLQHLKAVNVIGKEYQFIVYDINKEFDPNLYAALCGTLRGGGLLFILTPPTSDYLATCKSNNDWFMWRFYKKLTVANLVIKINVDIDNEQTITNQLNIGLPTEKQLLTEKQDLAIEKILHVVKGHRNRPLVLLADRGRGKSAALGIATGRLIKGGLKNIIITAPSIEACSIVFKHVKLNLPTATFQLGKVEFGSSRLLFMAPDNLIKTETKADLLIIDEASGISPSILEELLKRYSRIVFASTIHGYEGSGHCFSIKFFKYLDKLTPDWKEFHLDSPMRWSNSDPLEKLTDQLFLLKPEKDNLVDKINIEELTIEIISTQTLIQNESLLSDFYNLLSSAHYKTQPSDLKQVVNNTNIYIYLVKNSSTLVAAAFTIKEGQLNTEISEEIYLGNRRPKGHITPQSLLMHLGIKEAGALCYLRIMRIAVRPELQNIGIGSLLIKHIENDAKNRQFDFISCSFGVSNSLLNFWKKHNFSLARIGHHKKSQTNAHAALMLKPLSTMAAPVHTEALLHFKENFHGLLRENLAYLDSSISLTIFKHFIPSTENPLTSREYLSLESFANNNRTYEDNLYLVNRFSHFILCQKSTHDELNKEELNLIILKTLYSMCWPEIIKNLKIKGKNQAIIAFKKAISRLISIHQVTKQ